MAADERACENIGLEALSISIYDLGGEGIAIEFNFSPRSIDQLPGRVATDAIKPYEFFDPQEREELFRFCDITATYVDENDVGAVVFVDRGARPMGIGLAEYWKKFHADKPAPPMFFINPKGFRNQKNIKKRLEDEHPHLAKHKGDTILLIDTCIHAGYAKQPVIKGLSKCGFRDVRLGVVNDSRNLSNIKPDLVMQPYIPRGLCYPFGRPSTEVVKGKKLHSEVPDRSIEQSRRIVRIRNEIKRIINEHDYTESLDQFKQTEYAPKRRKANKGRHIAVGAAVGAAVGEVINLSTDATLLNSLANLAIVGISGGLWGNSIGNLRR